MSETLNIDQVQAMLARETRLTTDAIAAATSPLETDAKNFDQDTLAKAKAVYGTETANPLEQLDKDFSEMESEIKAAEKDLPDQPPADLSEGIVGMAALRRMAKTYINFLSKAMSVAAKRYYPAALLSPEDQAKADFMSATVSSFPAAKRAQARADFIAQDQEAAEIAARIHELDQLVKGAPLSDEEKDMLIEPLGAVLEKYRWMQAGPEAQLLLALVVIMAPRIAPFFGSKTQL